jgi:hypothetical protein
MPVANVEHSRRFRFTSGRAKRHKMFCLSRKAELVNQRHAKLSQEVAEQRSQNDRIDVESSSGPVACY